MNIVVCIKQVPEIALVQFVGDKLVLPEAPGAVNPFDEYALEEGLRFREKHGGTVTVMTCGEESAVSALRDGLALGADRAVLLADPAFVGSDGIAIGTILAAGIRKLGSADVCLFGKNAVDTDRSMVPGATAAKLNWPQALFVKKIESVESGKAVVLRMTEDGYDRVEIPLPGVISVVKEINEPRLPSLKGKLRAKSAPIDRWSAADLGVDAGMVGPHSATRVHAVHPPPPRRQCERLEGEPADVALALFEKLRADKVI